MSHHRYPKTEHGCVMAFVATLWVRLRRLNPVGSPNPQERTRKSAVRWLLRANTETVSLNKGQTAREQYLCYSTQTVPRTAGRRKRICLVQHDAARHHHALHNSKHEKVGVPTPASPTTATLTHGIDSLSSIANSSAAANRRAVQRTNTTQAFEPHRRWSAVPTVEIE